MEFSAVIGIPSAVSLSQTIWGGGKGVGRGEALGVGVGGGVGGGVAVKHVGSSLNIRHWEMFCDAFGNRCEGHIFAKFCFHAVLSLGNGSVIRPAAAFPDFAQGKRGVPSAQDNRQGSRRIAPDVRGGA